MASTEVATTVSYGDLSGSDSSLKNIGCFYPDYFLHVSQWVFHCIRKDRYIEGKISGNAGPGPREDDWGSLQRIVQRRRQAKLPLRVYMTSACFPCQGQGHEEHFAVKVKDWMRRYDFVSASPAEADVVVVQGQMDERDRVEAFTDVHDHEPLSVVGSSLIPSFTVKDLQAIASSENDRGEGGVHILTYQM